MDGKIPHSYLYKEGESMKKIVKLLLIIGLSLTLLGGCLFLVGFGLTGFDIFALQNAQFEEKEYIENTENPVTSIALDFDTTDIKVLFDENAERVVINYPQRKNLNGKDLGNVLVVESENGVKITEQRKITVPVLFNFPSPVATLTLPAGRAYDLSITTDTGDLSFFGNATCSSLLLETDTGDVNTSNSTILCKGKGKIETDTGDVKLGAFDAQELSVTTDTGDVRFTSGKANSITVTRTTGDFSLLGSLTASSLHVRSTTGDVEAKNGVIDASTITFIASTGDVQATLAGKQSDYQTVVQTDTGKSNVTSSSVGARTLNVETDTGDIHISFTEN